MMGVWAKPYSCAQKLVGISYFHPQALQIPAPTGGCISQTVLSIQRMCLTARNQHHGGALWHNYELDVGVVSLRIKRSPLVCISTA
jgi:hypothetical protein